MRYMLMICSEEAAEEKMSAAEMGELMNAYMKFHQEAEAAGVLRGGDRLRPVADATSVKVRDGKVDVTDGPFAETKEQLGGYYMVDVKNLDEAIVWAGKIPSAAIGTVEIRPIWEPEDYMPDGGAAADA